MSDYERFLQLFENLKYEYAGILLNNVAACQIWDMANHKLDFPLRHLGNLFMAYNFSNLKLPTEGGFVSTFMESNRLDHRSLYDSVLNKLSIKPTLNELHTLSKICVFNPGVIFAVSKKILRQLAKSKLSLVQKLQWVAEYVLYINSIKELDKLDLTKIDRYLCMCHVLGLENLLTQYFRKKKIETYSLQEGIYFIYEKRIVLGFIAYFLFETDHLLCWGEYTKEEFVRYGIHPERISVAGHPKFSELRPFNQKNPFKKCLVLLAGPIFGDVNKNLLIILEFIKESIEITLKPHPSNYDEMESYATLNNFKITPKSQVLGDCFTSGEYDFCIGVNTTAYYESWMAGIPCIRYNDVRFDVFYGFDDLFSNKDELLSLIQKYREEPLSVDKVKSMLKYAIGVGIDNYNALITE